MPKDLETLYVEARVNAMLHMGAVSPEVVDENTGDPDMSSALPIASTLGFYVMANGGPYQGSDRFKGVDPRNEYLLNKWGCRDSDYTGAVDLITAGCSMTFGQGVPVETRWSSVLGKMLDMSVATLAIPGWSIQSSVNAVMAYIKKFGKPKVVALYLPDFFRYDFIANRTSLVPPKNHRRPQDGVPMYLAKGEVLPSDQQPTYSKKPHDIADVFSTETAHFMSGQALAFLIEYCKEANIKLVYATWHPAADEYIKFVQRAVENLEQGTDEYTVMPEVDLSGYVDMDMFYPKNIKSLAKTTDDLISLTCHQDLKSQYGTYFDLGTDTDKHIGVHAHAHVAEKFAAAISGE